MSNPIRFVTAASLFDGHDVSINIMRRMLQAKGAEVIHLGHNRSAKEVVDAAIMEDAHAIALSSYQGGHMEYFTYIRELLDELGAKDMRIFGGGGGVITPSEVEELHKRGVTRIYTPMDGMNMGLEGIIDDMLKTASERLATVWPKVFQGHLNTAQAISCIENGLDIPKLMEAKKIPVLGITGTGGAGKSSLIDELLLRFHAYAPEHKVALISVDPTKKRTQGALLGDRIRLGSAVYEQFFIRSLATRGSGNELSPKIKETIQFLRSQDFDLIMVETSGIGQASDEITNVSDHCIYVMTPEYGAQTQLEKIEMLEVADAIVLNKFEKQNAQDALRDIRKQYKRNHKLFSEQDENLPVFATMASKFNDVGVNGLFTHIADALKLDKIDLSALDAAKQSRESDALIPPERSNYLAEIAAINDEYNQKTDEISAMLEDFEGLEKAATLVSDSALKTTLTKQAAILKDQVGSDVFSEIERFRQARSDYSKGEFKFSVRGKELSVGTKFQSLSQQEVSRVGLPKYDQASLIYRYLRRENRPGEFPFSAGIFPFSRKDEDPKRQFAGEGGPGRTNKRFHFLSEKDQFKRLSTAFDSVTLYGEDPAKRPDIYGKIGESGVSIATLDDMCDLYAGFDLCDPRTSVSKTINGPASVILAMFMNAAMKQQLSESDMGDWSKCIDVMRKVRGTVQADILKEDQAQNTCIFSLDFALRLMGDVQAYFSKNSIRNYYTVSISGYHIAEAGANPITQLAFTLANGLTYVEYYLRRGIPIDDFCENLSFFFSNGLDPEYTVIGRVARKIWAVTLRERYGANIKSQKLKYHIQTSGRSLHAQEMAFNDIRTTLQAFLALSDQCNSLHTNAYDEAITTPTEESVRRAMAIQMIINREFGLNAADNPLQGSYIVDELTDLVETAVLDEFRRISQRGGVLGSMESMYQRGKIQEESLYYETLKDSGELPIIGVNTYVSDDIHEQMQQEIELTRASYEEKDDQISRLESFQKRNLASSKQALEKLKSVARGDGNIFEELLKTVRVCSLGEITNALFDVGGRYRRNM